MKSFKEYLTESTKVYEFKVKIAGECPGDCSSQLKAALAQFHVASVSTGKRTPIQERQAEFPEHKNVNMTIFDVCTKYPATSKQVRDMVSERLGIALGNVKVKNQFEELEHDINHEHDEKSGEALLGADYENTNHQDLVGDKRKMSFLASISKEKHEGKQYTGVNDELFPKAAKAKAQAEMATETKAVKSVVGSRKVKLTPVGAK